MLLDETAKSRPPKKNHVMHVTEKHAATYVMIGVFDDQSDRSFSQRNVNLS